jgi:hypothetical protein
MYGNICVRCDFVNDEVYRGGNFRATNGQFSQRQCKMNLYEQSGCSYIRYNTVSYQSLYTLDIRTYLTINNLISMVEKH